MPHAWNWGAFVMHKILASAPLWVVASQPGEGGEADIGGKEPASIHTGCAGGAAPMWSPLPRKSPQQAGQWRRSEESTSGEGRKSPSYDMQSDRLCVLPRYGARGIELPGYQAPIPGCCFAEAETSNAKGGFFLPPLSPPAAADPA